MKTLILLLALLAGRAAADCTDPINQAATGQHWPQNGAVINRINDRLLVGPASASDAAWPNVQQDWLSQMLWPVAPVLGTQAAVLSGTGQYGIVTGARSSDNPTEASDGTIGLGAWAINDKINGSAYAIYAEGIRYAGAWGPTFAAELEVSNETGAVAPITPYTHAAGETIALNLGAGIGRARPGAAPASAALMINANPQPFDKGIVFGAASISGGEAITLAEGQAIAWHNAGGPIATLGATGLTINGRRVLGPRVTGWASPAGYTYRGAWSSSTVTHYQLATIVAALIRDLQTQGVIGP